MANTDGYSLMTDVGNVYALEYVDHVINVSTDSSHFMDSSYAIPFFGLVFHGSLNYAGAPLNYSGSPEYDMLRSIENGASLYYIICNENTGFLKEDPLLSDYYGIDYENWFDKIVEQYTVLNEAIGDLQYHNIVDHDIVYAERVIDDDEMLDNYNRLALEYISKVNDCLSEKIDDKQKELRENGSSVPGLEVIIDRDSLMYTLAEMLGVDFEDDALATESAAKLATLKSISAVYAELNTELDTLLMTYPSVEYAYEVEIDVNKLALTDITLDNACSKIVEAIEAVITSAKERHPDRDIAVELNKDEIIAFVYDAIGIEAIEANAAIELDAVIDSYESIYTTSDNELNFSSADVIYDSLYSYTTDSISTDKENYKYTDFTCDNGSVVMVTYKKGNETVIFLLNYNFFTVEITIDNTVDKSLLDGETKTYTLGQCEYVRIDNK